MKAALILLALCFCGAATACSHVYTHERSQRGRMLAEGCKYNHAQAGRDWPAGDKECGWTCSGKSQSPINIPDSGTDRLKSGYKANINFGIATNLRVLNIGHAVQVEFDSPKKNKGSVVFFGDSIYTMYNATKLRSKDAHRVNVEPLQFHFHATSEHLLSGRSTMLELHLVTKLVKTPGQPLPKECPTEDDLCLAVFGVMYDITTDPTATKGDKHIEKIIKAMPKDCEEAGKECLNEMSGELNLRDLFPNTKYYGYTGSLTTPPCSEGVMWHVFPKVKATMTERQALDLQVALATAQMGGKQVYNRLNNRVTMPWNGRTVFRA